MRPSLPADPPAEVPSEWLALLDALPAEGRLVVIGAGDSGKTTLCWWLARELTRRAGPGAAAALVDTDIGQSRVGPPTCVGWQRIGAPDLGFFFVGATTPARRPSSMLHATARACDAAAESGASWTVVDTTGYVRGELAVALKTAKIKRLRPVHVVAIGNPPSLAAILSPWEGDPLVTVHRLPTPPATRVRPPVTRANWRREQFAAWLSGCNLRRLERAGREFLHEPAAELFAGAPGLAAQLKGLLLGFSDSAGCGICIGLVHSLGFTSGTLTALCPEEAQAAETIDFGCIRLEPDGTQTAAARADG